MVINSRKRFETNRKRELGPGGPSGPRAFLLVFQWLFLMFLSFQSCLTPLGKAKELMSQQEPTPSVNNPPQLIKFAGVAAAVAVEVAATVAVNGGDEEQPPVNKVNR